MAKNIVICCDGTGQNGLRHTNVSRLFTILYLDEPNKQIACYDPGVGTIPHREVKTAVQRRDAGVVCRHVFDRPTPVSYLLSRLWCLAGLAVGTGLFQNVQEMYEILIDNYVEGDHIFLFGFSRGAFTVRVLAGLLHRCGLLLPMHRGCYAKAFELYKPHCEQLKPDEAEKLKEEIAKFKSLYTRSCEISFLGIWDTVKSVGYFYPVSMPHTRRNPIVKTVRHALSIGESRSFYVPTTWGGLDNDTQPPIEGQDIKEIWFAGSHSDVGGGYEEEESALAKISLRWMIEEAKKAKGEWEYGLLIDKDRYQQMFPQDATPSFRLHNELKGWSWWTMLWLLSEILPRTELQNDPPPPKRLRKWGPSGQRSMGKFGREGVVLIDSWAREVYSPKVPPWSDLYSEGKPKSGSWLLSVKDLKDAGGLIRELRDAQKPLSQYLLSQFSPDLQQGLKEYDDSGSPSKPLQQALVDELNRLLRGECLYQKDRFAQIDLTRVTKELLQQNPQPQGEDLILLNRWLLEDAYPRKTIRTAKVEFVDAAGGPGV